MADNELNKKELDNVTGGSNHLDKYLKRLAGKDKNKVLVDHGSGTSLKLDNSIESDGSGNLIIIEREKDDADKIFPDLDLGK